MQLNRIFNPDLVKFVEKMVRNTKRKERTPLLTQQEVEQWCNFCTDLFEEVQAKRKFSSLREVIKREKLRNVQKDKTYACRLQLFEFLGEKILGASFSELIAFFLAYKGNSFVEEVKNLCRSFDEDKVPTLSCARRLD